MDASSPALNVTVAALSTADMKDRDTALLLTLVSGMVRNLGAVLLLTTLAREQDTDRPTTAPAPGGRPAERPPLVEGVYLPDVSQRSPDDAEELLQGRGLKTTRTQVESTEPIDTVVDTDPKADTVVSRGSTVRIYVSAGVLVPALIGKSIDDAVAELELAGFGEPRVSAAEGSGRANTVATQDPAGGTFAEAGSAVSLTFYPRHDARLREIVTEE